MTGMKTHYGRVHGVWSKDTSHRDEGRQVMIWPCKRCDKEFANFENLHTHASSVHDMIISKNDVDVETRHEFVKDHNGHLESVYSCPHCQVSFDNTKAIRVHSFKKHGILLNDAELSEWKSGDDTSKNTPTERTPEQLRYNCRRCNGKFRTTKAIRIHTFKRHGFILSKKELARCKSWIPKSSLNEQPVNRNRGKDLIDEANPCDKCGRIFGNYRALFTHYRQAHRVLTEESPSRPKKPSRTELTMKYADDISKEDALPNSIDCPKCERSYTQHKSLVAHLYSAHKIAKDQYPLYWPNGMPVLPRESRNCPTCDKECVDDRAMRIHMFKAHGTHYRDLEKIAKMEEMEASLAAGGGNVIVKEQGPINENELSVVEEIKGPPVCFICGRLFKSRRALMTHEYKFHDIRWVGRKRIFPQQVRNLPNMDNVTSVSSRKSNVLDKSENDVPTEVTKTEMNYSCPECGVSYHNRRAITTHLCRIHKYKRDDIHAYLGEPSLNQNGCFANRTSDLTSHDTSDNLTIVGASDNEASVVNDVLNSKRKEKTESDDVPLEKSTNEDSSTGI